MNGDGTLLLLADLKELIHNVLRGACTVRKLQVQVVDTAFLENFLIILRFVETDSKCYSKLLEDGNVVLGCEGTIFVMNWHGS